MGLYSQLSSEIKVQQIGRKDNTEKLRKQLLLNVETTNSVWWKNVESWKQQKQDKTKVEIVKTTE